MVSINRVNGDLQTAQGSDLTTGLETWLQSKGIEVEGSFLIDATCGSVTVQQQQGPFLMNTPVSFPFLPLFLISPTTLLRKDWNKLLCLLPVLFGLLGIVAIHLHQLRFHLLNLALLNHLIFLISNGNGRRQIYLLQI